MEIFPLTPNPAQVRRQHKSTLGERGVLTRSLLSAVISAVFLSSVSRAQKADPDKPVVVQPGAPGAPSRTLPPSTRAVLPPKSAADVAFMQGMIMHHEQAVEMTAMIASHTQNKELHLLGARISSSQSDEIKFMKRWLAARGEAVPSAMPEMPDMQKMPGMDMPHEPSHSASQTGGHSSLHPMLALMPGMLTLRQMEALRIASGAKFDQLFLTGMIQHHNGALEMVKDLFDTPGAGQDAELFNFATDADNTQRAEIGIMDNMLREEEKR